MREREELARELSSAMQAHGGDPRPSPNLPSSHVSSGTSCIFATPSRWLIRASSAGWSTLGKFELTK